MQKKGSSYKFTIAERVVIKMLIDKKYGKISTAIDYQSYGDYNYGVEGDIYTQTSETISGSTLERLVGLRPNEDRGIRNSTLNIIVKYLDFSNLTFFLKKIEYTIQNPKETVAPFKISNVFVSHFTRIEYTNKKQIQLRHISSNKFEVIGTKNTRFLIRDTIEIVQLEIGLQFICKNVERVVNNERINLGLYHSTDTNSVASICFYK